MRGCGRFLLGLAVAIPATFAAGPVASVVSSQAFNLDGTVVANPGVTLYPIVIHDRVETLDSDALLSFKDGSTIDVAANSEVKVEGSETSPSVVLVAGKLNYKIAAGSRVQVTEAPDDQDNGQADNDKDKKKKKKKGAAVPIDFENPNDWILYASLPIVFGGLALAVDAILQPGPISPL